MKNRKKGNVVATTGRYVAKLGDSRGVSFSAKIPTNNIPSKETDDDEDLDSASVIRHLHKEVNEFVAQPVDLMEIVDSASVQKEFVSPVTRSTVDFLEDLLRLWGADTPKIRQRKSSLKEITGCLSSYPLCCTLVFREGTIMEVVHDWGHPGFTNGIRDPGSTHRPPGLQRGWESVREK
ncbi:hypothetical protein LWI29_033756 [Acer saccharum]|uniref:Uncharacterized protein n=1 Tax=Acer saccharum TaxID=4024 RepID=A0AA39SBI7_ACESA|nr:hypothetical protein LWI29_033756 [Acer saccharum]